MKGFIVTGTDTGIGKTVFSAALTGALLRRHGAARYWKPVQAGLEEVTDSEAVGQLAPGALIHPEAYRLVTPASPHLAARIDGVVIERARLTLPEGDAPLVVEGAGGALVPLEGSLLYADLFSGWGLPVVVVARTGLGTINHTLMTIEALRVRRAIIAGIAFVGDAHEENEAVIPALSGVARLGRLPLLPQLTPQTLASAFDEGFAGWSL
ncbi:MAG: ATP-dependent dethiobiotin synthetase BioD [Sphingomonadales bacterium]|nr:ATP-dependent dethiobiotin synthetase BioD [Sphingomonadales bacterium]MDE2168788.1 ATP-dependent dethiobiotin synthetase BioD [Sphingomonadales bacterium]